MRNVKAEAQAALVLEMTTGTAYVNGEAVELPLKEFKLLAELASHVGEPVEASALIAAAWPEAPWTTAQDLYVLVSKLRRLIDGTDSFGQNVRNRRGFGYRLDLPAAEVVVIEGGATQEVVIDLRDEEVKTENPGESSYVATEPPDEPSQASVTTQASPASEKRSTGLWLSSAIAMATALLGLSWAGGFLVSRHFSSRSERPAESRVAAPRNETTAPPGLKKSDDKTKKGSGQKLRNDGSERDTHNGSSASSLAFVVPGPGTGSGKSGPASSEPARGDQGPTGTSEPKNASGDAEKETRRDPAPPELPPAPTRYLYHLVNAKSGDHFVTTDGNAASEFEAKGYEGGAIGRIYSYREDGTRAITTDAGTAYVFIASSPKTEPSSRTVALWYATNNNGDFFYTTSESNAKHTGWTGSLIGYVRSL
jgi:DNA-binding winged helix-turn-helix (wHTH) protein